MFKTLIVFIHYKTGQNVAYHTKEEKIHSKGQSETYLKQKTINLS